MNFVWISREVMMKRMMMLTSITVRLILRHYCGSFWIRRITQYELSHCQAIDIDQTSTEGFRVSHNSIFFFWGGGNEMNNDYKLNCEYFFSCPGQLNRWHCQSVSEWVSKSLLISASSEHCRAVVDNDNDNDNDMRHLRDFWETFERL